MSAHTTSRYFVHSWSGLIFATIAGIAATSIIVQDAFPNGWADWSHAKLDHALAPVIVAITAFLWLHAMREMREGKLTAIPLAIVATFCSGLIVFESMGRGAESLDTKIAVTTKTVDQYAAIAADYERTKKLVEEAEKWVAGECASGRGKKCEGQTFILNQRKASAEKLKADLERANAPVPVDARGDRVAFLAGWAGYNGEMAKKAAQSLYPLARPLAFEFVMILLLHASVRTRAVSVASVPAVDSVPLVSTVAEPKALSFENEKGDRTDQEIEDMKKQLLNIDREIKQVLEALVSSGRPLCNDELTDRLPCKKSETSKRSQRAYAEGLIKRWQEGRFVYAEPTEKGRKLLSLVV